jgi:hypothetical protein
MKTTQKHTYIDRNILGWPKTAADIPAAARGCAKVTKGAAFSPDSP